MQNYGNKMVLSREHHSYLQQEVDTTPFWKEPENKLVLGSKGLQLTIVKPLFKEDRSTRPGIYVSDVLRKRFEESLREESIISSTRRDLALLNFVDFEASRKHSKSQTPLEKIQNESNRFNMKKR